MTLSKRALLQRKWNTTTEACVIEFNGRVQIIVKYDYLQPYNKINYEYLLLSVSLKINFEKLLIKLPIPILKIQAEFKLYV